MSVRIQRIDTQGEDYEESEVEEGPRFSKSTARNRSTSTISKKTPRNSSNIRLRLKRETQNGGIDSIISRRLSESHGVLKPPSAHQTHRSFRSNFSLHSSNINRMKNSYSR